MDAGCGQLRGEGSQLLNHVGRRLGMSFLGEGGKDDGPNARRYGAASSRPLRPLPGF